MKASSFWSSSDVHGPFFSPASFSQHGDRPIAAPRAATTGARRTAGTRSSPRGRR
uniref:Uncharacterized protein n=1 Tax=Zea mays TaxID=4577 RepID=C4J3J4_MAIZE|nr:unknown [Zea mays]